MIARCERYLSYLETLTPEKLVSLPNYVTDDVRFKDPFNDVTGIDAMRRVFDHMFRNVKDIRFSVRHVLGDQDYCLMTWRFQGMLRGKPWAFDGTSMIRFAPDGRVAEHIDYWDAASEFYQRLPVIGPMISWVRRRLAVDG
jgi:steroid Delta-isomerase